MLKNSFRLLSRSLAQTQRPLSTKLLLCQKSMSQTPNMVRTMAYTPIRGFAVLPKRTEFFNFSATMIDGTKVEKLDDLVGDKKAILVVNVASE
jgi:hypothetical protein